jgi:hypothetical protein
VPIDVRRPGAIGILVGALVASLLVAILGFSLWPLAAVIWALGTLLLAQRIGWRLGAIGALATMLAIETFLLRLFPAVPLDLATSHEVAWGVAGAVLIALTVRRSTVQLPSRATLLTALAAGSAALVGAVIVVIAAIASGSSIVSWSMNNDAVWTTLQAQHIYADGGINTQAHPNPSPLMSALMATGAAPGRASLAPMEQLQSDIVRDGQLWVLVILGTSLLVGIIVTRVFGVRHPRWRFVAAFILGCTPFSWYVSGFAVQFGFYSASLAVLLLMCCWALWQSARTHPFWVFAFLALLATCILATWALLVPIPVALAGSIVVRDPRAFFERLRPLRIVVCCVAVLQLLVYGIFVGIPDFLSHSVALSTSGGIQNSPPESLAALVVVTLGLTALVGIHLGRYDDLRGAIAVMVGIAAGLGLLLLQGSGGWTYYPAKFGWLSSILLLVIVVAALIRLLLFAVTRRRLIVVASILSLIVVAAVAIKSPPPSRNLLSLTPLASALGGQAHHQDQIAARLFSLSDPGHKVMVSRYSADVADDEFLNLWLLQSTSQMGTERVRDFAYSLVPTSAQQVCGAIAAWGGDVTVETTVSGWGAQLHAACRNEVFTVHRSQ